ncbi:hypothetical protein C8Q80DRAFT_1125319 [Daedaleopsis nitida]|nr:hypothetical protein C8Q80DRAFT_1125319 [Daedaleopsis nitida]
MIRKASKGIFPKLSALQDICCLPAPRPKSQPSPALIQYVPAPEITTSEDLEVTSSPQPRPRAPVLPPESIDHIISFVEVKFSLQGTETILNCALVSQSWVPASRLRLFQRIQLRGPRQYNLFNTNIVRSALMQPWLTHIRSITVDNCARRFPLPDLANRLPNLRFLYIIGADWIRTPLHPRVWGTFSSLSVLHTLALNACRLPSFAALCRLLTVLPHLRDLHISAVTCPALRHPLMFAHQRSRPALSGLSMFMMSSGDPDNVADTLLDWLARTPTRRSLKALKLESEKPWPDSYVRFVREVAPRLTVLQGSKITADFLRLPISEMVDLGHLSLQFDDEGEAIWRDLASVLAQLQGRELRALVLQQVPVRINSGIDNYDVHVVGPDGVAQLGPILASERFQKLLLVRFDFVGKVTDKNLMMKWYRSRKVAVQVLHELRLLLPKLHVIQVAWDPTCS